MTSEALTPMWVVREIIKGRMLHGLKFTLSDRKNRQMELQIEKRK
jgi:hypothetical protein